MSTILYSPLVEGPVPTRAVDARKGVGDYANVSGLLSNVHQSVTAVGTATTMIAMRYQLCDYPYLYS